MQSFIGSEDKLHSIMSSSLNLISQYIPLYGEALSTQESDYAATYYQSLGFTFREYLAYKYKQADLYAGINQMAEDIEGAGCRIYTGSNVNAVTSQEDNCHYTVHYQDSLGSHTIQARYVVLAVGRQGRSLLRNVAIPGVSVQVPQKLDVGLRLEYPTELWPEIDKYHNDLKLQFESARTFCVSKDGWITPYHINQKFFMEGRTDFGQQSGLSNLGITIRLGMDAEELLSSVETLHNSETGGLPTRQLLGDYLEGRSRSGVVSQSADRDLPASFTYWRWGSCHSIYPPAVSGKVMEAVEYFVEKMLGDEAVNSISLFGPELDYYWECVSPGRGFKVPGENVYAIGDATGAFRGILQAFASGREAANHLVRDAHGE